MKIIWSPLAIDRVSEIAEYIASDSLYAAHEFVRAIFKRVEALRRFPQIGREVLEVERPDIRELIHGNYRIIYRVQPEKLYVLTVRHARQMLPIEETE